MLDCMIDVLQVMQVYKHRDKRKVGTVVYCWSVKQHRMSCILSNICVGGSTGSVYTVEPCGQQQEMILRK